MGGEEGWGGVGIFRSVRKHDWWWHESIGFGLRCGEAGR